MADDRGRGLPRPAARTASAARLYRNHGDGTFSDVTQGSRARPRRACAWALNFGDLDNDGWLDIYLGTGNPDLATWCPTGCSATTAGTRFQDVTTAGGFGHLQKGHGVAFGDIDNDGDQDIFAQMGGAYRGDKAYSALFENPGNANHWVTLELEGVRSNRSAIGARIEVRRRRRRAGPRAIHRAVGSGGDPEAGQFVGSTKTGSP